MSAFALNKLDIDILVELALYGPAQAARPWSAYDGPLMTSNEGGSQPADASALGAALWRLTGHTTRASHGQQTPPGYVVERAPCPITAIEGLKLVAILEYRLLELDRFKGAAAGFCNWLREALIWHLPGFDDAPLTWSASDVDVRADRVRAASTPEVLAEPDPEIVAMIATLAAHGVQLAPYAGVDQEPPQLERRGFHDRPYRKIGHWANTIHHSGDPVHLRIYADQDAAHAAYVARRAVLEHRRGWRGRARPGLRVARHGRAVIEYIGPTPDTIDPNSPRAAICTAVVPAFAALGRPDEAWAHADVEPVAQVGEGTVLDTKIALPLGYGDGIRVVTDRRGLQEVADLVCEPAAKQRILDTDLEKHTILMMNGIANVDAVRGARLTELIAPDGQKPGYLLELNTDGLCYIPSVIVALPKLPARPTEIDIYDSASGRSRHWKPVLDAPSPWSG